MKFGSSGTRRATASNSPSAISKRARAFGSPSPGRARSTRSTTLTLTRQDALRLTAERARRSPMASDACLTAAIRLLVAEGYIVVERNLQEPERPDKVWRVVDREQ